MAEPQPKKLKTENDELQFFRNYLSEETNEMTISHLRGASLGFESGYSHFNMALLRVKNANANSFARFSKATIDTEAYRTASLRLFYMRGYCTLRDFVDKRPKVPENLDERRALEDLLLFLANIENSIRHFFNYTDRKVIVENRGNTESDAALALRLAQHLLIPLVRNKTFVIDSYPGLQLKCCQDEHPLNGRKGDTSFGCPKGWHGRADILLMDEFMDGEVPLTVIETPGNDDTTADDASSVTSDSSVEVKKGEDFSVDSIFQIIAQTIVFSFLQRKKNTLAPCSLVPGIGICSGKLIVYWYDCVEDILLTTGMLDLFISSAPDGLNYHAVIILWLVLNHNLFGNEIPEKYKHFPASFHKLLGPAYLEMYKNESQQPCTIRNREDDILKTLQGVWSHADWEEDMLVFTEAMKNLFPKRKAVSLN